MKEPPNGTAMRDDDGVGLGNGRDAGGNFQIPA